MASILVNMPCRRLLLGAIGTPVSRMCSISELICINPNKSVPLWLFSASHPLHAFPFHSIASGPGKRHPNQIKKNNLAKRASALAALQASKPSPIVSGPSAFLDSLARPTPPTDPAVPPPQGSAWQYLLTAEEEQFLFMDTPLIVAELAADGSNSTVEREREKAGVVKRIVGLGNASAKAVGVWNVRRAVEYFGRKVGDTGNSEVQAAILTVRIQNLNKHLEQHHKDRHNYRQLRSMVHQRANVLRYLKRKDLSRYYTCLKELGLEQRAVEGEIVL
ncbi:hypothetical protein BC936DRAFT_137682 [Jimgerdemannia flammicorona]|uniref:Ribosomal protein S15 n=1 Tax=Jimgerdemannia flammicorona TaxID=994334 RepID=A0A433DIU5_9FUNG|nr:hypothetical protein BC936DRAFT_137682 [Jimgerdemannia flammicorona]